jgi:hypothetical protein
MITFRVSADVRDDRRVVLTLPSEVPIGKNELIVSIATTSELDRQCSCDNLADWAERNSEHWGSRLSATDVEGFTGRGG